jgi:alkylhydroperoxidase/carboxymuconolactone decarboxylase family protein YurZ
MPMSGNEPPRSYSSFKKRFPQLGEAWELTRAGSSDGPLSPETALLVKLGIAAGALREGAVHSATRKAVAGGVSRQAIEQVVALSASTLGFPACVAVFTWTQDVLDKPDKP